MKKGWVFLGTLGLGAGIMYALDPQRGRFRRARVRDRVVHSWHDAEHALVVARVDLAQRARGVWAESRWLWRHTDDTVDDDTLVARVRSHIGRAVLHPHAIHVESSGGRITLAGPLLSDEVLPLVAAVAQVRGVIAVDAAQLEPHDGAGHVPALQGAGRTRTERRPWQVPAAHGIEVGVGAALVVAGLTRSGLVRLALSSAGLALVAAGITRVGSSARVTVQKSIVVHAPVEEVYALWSRFENLPRFLGHVREVTTVRQGRTRWLVAGPAGIVLEWEAELTRSSENQLIAWRTVPGSRMEHTGIVRFERVDRGTRVDVRMTYAPPAGRLGHAVARLLGADPRRALDEDLLRLQNLFAHGTPDYEELSYDDEHTRE